MANDAGTRVVTFASALPATPASATPAEPHPQIREALAALRRAKELLREYEEKHKQGEAGEAEQN